MTAVAPQPQARAAEPVAPVARPRPHAERQPRVTGGIVWIVVIGILLAGVVFMNVAVLRLNIQLDKQGRSRTQLRSDIASLSSQVSSAQAAARIQALARKQLGVRPAEASDTTFLTLK